MIPNTFLACVVVLAVAGLAHGTFGIGFGMIATPLLAMFVDYTTAIVLTLGPLAVISGSWLVRNRHLFRSSPQALRMLPAIAGGALLGGFLHFGLSEVVALLLLAFLLAASGLTPWVLARIGAVNPVTAMKTSACYGALAGLTESALNVGAPFLVLYGALAQLTRIQQFLVLNLCFLVGKIIQVSLLAIHGGLVVDTVTVASGSAAALMAYFLGERLSGAWSESTFRRALQVFLFCMVAALIGRATHLLLAPT